MTNLFLSLELKAVLARSYLTKSTRNHHKLDMAICQQLLMKRACAPRSKTVTLWYRLIRKTNFHLLNSGRKC